MQIWMYDHCGASDAQIRAGVAAADAFFAKRGIDPEQAYAGALAQADGVTSSTVQVLASAWDTAELYAIGACCDGWARWPESIHIAPA